MMTVTPLRTWTIGGSECAAAAGIHPYVSRVQLWAEKTGRMERAATEAMRWGNLLEGVIFERLRMDGWEVGQRDEPYALGDSWATGNPDGFVELATGEAVLEVKTIGQWAHREGVAPVQYDAQCQWYMHLTGLDRALLAMLVGGQRLELIELDRNDRAIALLLELGEEFIDYLRRDTPPPPDGSDSAREALSALFPQHHAGAVIRLTPDQMGTLYDLRERRAQLDTVKAQVAELENTLKLAMGDAETAISPSDQEVLRWRTSTTRRVDTTELKAQRPELAEMFTTETTQRRFTVL